MTAIVTRDQIRAYDRHAIERCSVPGIVLMENAGRGAVDIVAALAAEPALGRLKGGEAGGRSVPPVVIVCGPGNNGGDGFVVARHLLARGMGVQVFLAGTPERVRGDARVNLDAWVGVGGEIAPLSAAAADLDGLRAALEGASLAVDGLFGTGLDRPIEGYRRDVIALLNELPCPIVALDIPSGIDADRGQVHGIAVHAAHTVTFAHFKSGMFVGAGADHAGVLHRAGLGLPDEAILEAVGTYAELIEPRAVRQILGRRPADSHKYRAGSLLVVAGRPGKVGAALLAARGALRTGAGIVTIGTGPEAADRIDVQASEVMTARLDPSRLDETLEAALDRRNAVAIGPGLGLDDAARQLTERIVLGFEGPVVVDADGISHFAGRPEALRAAAGPRVLTPHAGELARLLGSSSPEVEADRFGSAQAAATATGQVVLLKGRNTIIATPEQRRFVCSRGNALLGTAGSGDVLTGMVGALLCLAPPAAAASAAAYLHGTVAERWYAEHRADRGMVASDIIAGVPDAIAALAVAGE